jgi:hypothetical protein
MKSMQGMLAGCAMSFSLCAHAQLVSVDNGAAVEDSSGLMFANTVGTDLRWTQTASQGGTQGWIASLNAEDYGGYNDWILATADYGSQSPNTTTNQLAQLFNGDCGNVIGTATSFTNSGKNCSAFTAAVNATNVGLGFGDGNPGNMLFFSSSFPPGQNPPYPPEDFVFTVYDTQYSQVTGWTGDESYDGLTGQGDAIAVREAPELDPSSAATVFVFLLGGLAVLTDSCRQCAR